MALFGDGENPLVQYLKKLSGDANDGQDKTDADESDTSVGSSDRRGVPGSRNNAFRNKLLAGARAGTGRRPGSKCNCNGGRK